MVRARMGAILRMARVAVMMIVREKANHLKRKVEVDPLVEQQAKLARVCLVPRRTWKTLMTMVLMKKATTMLLEICHPNQS